MAKSTRHNTDIISFDDAPLNVSSPLIKKKEFTPSKKNLKRFLNGKSPVKYQKNLSRFLSLKIATPEKERSLDLSRTRKTSS